jgi:hypothetical protein
MHPLTSDSLKPRNLKSKKDEIQYSQKVKLKPPNEILKLANGLLGSFNFQFVETF